MLWLASMPIFSSFHIMLTAINGKSSWLTRPTTIIEKRYKRIGTPHINGKGIFPLFHLYINIKANKKIVRRTQSNGLKTILLKEIRSHMDKHVLIELKKKKNEKVSFSLFFFFFFFFFLNMDNCTTNDSTWKSLEWISNN